MLDVTKRTPAEIGKCDSVTTAHFTRYASLLTVLVRVHQSVFIQGQTIATLSAMTIGFAIKNARKYRARRMTGP
jgi:hypothetical protein